MINSLYFARQETCGPFLCWRGCARVSASVRSWRIVFTALYAVNTTWGWPELPHLLEEAMYYFAPIMLPVLAAAFISLISINDLHRRVARYREMCIRLETACGAKSRTARRGPGSSAPSPKPNACCCRKSSSGTRSRASPSRTRLEVRGSPSENGNDASCRLVIGLVWCSSSVAVVMPSTPPNDRSDEREPRAFATSNWSMIAHAGATDSPGSRAALEQLCRAYWYPLYWFSRNCGLNQHDAEDLIQAFF